MELELTCCTCFCINTFITLFLYGIGADVSKITTSEFFIITLFLYGIGAGVAFTMIQRMYVITLFLYGIGANLLISIKVPLLILHYSYMELEPNS